MSELKPCPFCGNENVAIANECHDLSGGYFIACPACGGSTGLRYACGEDPRPLLVEQWNRRTARSGQAASGSSQGARSDVQDARAVIEQCRDALAEEMAAWDIDPKISHVQEAHDACERWLGVGQPEAPTAAPLVPEGFKLLKDTTYEERSWPEDMPHENGYYSCTCVECLRTFTGHKRRVVCKACAHPPARSGAGSEEGQG